MGRETLACAVLAQPIRAHGAGFDRSRGLLYKLCAVRALPLLALPARAETYLLGNGGNAFATLGSYGTVSLVQNAGIGDFLHFGSGGATAANFAADILLGTATGALGVTRLVPEPRGLRQVAGRAGHHRPRGVAAPTIGLNALRGRQCARAWCVPRSRTGTEPIRLFTSLYGIPPCTQCGPSLML